MAPAIRAGSGLKRKRWRAGEGRAESGVRRERERALKVHRAGKVPCAGYRRHNIIRNAPANTPPSPHVDSRLSIVSSDERREPRKRKAAIPHLVMSYIISVISLFVNEQIFQAACPRKLNTFSATSKTDSVSCDRLRLPSLLPGASPVYSYAYSP